jgi:hypothetical protein
MMICTRRPGYIPRSAFLINLRGNVMRTLITCAVALAASSLAFAATACDNPALSVTIPDGKTATFEQMLAAQNEIKTYQAAMNDFVACLDTEIDAQGEETPAEIKSLLVTRHDDAVAEMENVANAFNEQVKAYKAANPAPAK